MEPRASSSAAMDIDDSPLQDIERSIRAVEAKIEEVEKQLTSVEDPEERRYLRKEKEQLRKEKEQLRKEKEQVRKEKEQVREKELLLLKSKVSGVPGVPLEIDHVSVTKCLDAVWDNVIGSNWDSFPLPESFKSDFPGCSRKVCTIREQADLLWDGLEGVAYHAKAIEDHVRGAKAKYCILLNVSGSGKTRSLYELSVRTPCIFLAGSPPGLVRGEGSGDLVYLSEFLLGLYGLEMIPSEAVECVAAALLVCRLYVYRRTERELGKHFTNIVWLFKQVCFDLLPYKCGESDVFLCFTRRLLAAFATSKGVLPTLLTALNSLLWDYKWRGIIAIDEAQALNSYLENRFADSKSKMTRSFLYAFSQSLRRILPRDCVIYISGTGCSLLQMAQDLSGTAKANLGGVTIFEKFGGFQSPEQIEQYTKQILNESMVAKLEFKKLYDHFKGRFRFYAMALQRMLNSQLLQAENPDLMAHLLEFAELLATESRIKGIKKTVLHDLQIFLDSKQDKFEIKHMVSKLAMCCILQSYRPVDLVIGNIKLVECGLGKLLLRRDANADEGTVFFEGMDLMEKDECFWDYTVIVWEPIVRRCMFNYFGEDFPASFCASGHSEAGNRDPFDFMLHPNYDER